MLQRYLASSSSHQLFLAAVIIEEWACIAEQADEAAKTTSLATTNTSVQGLAAKLVDFLEKPPPATYHEMTVLLTRIQAESQGLTNAFAVEGKVKRDKLPVLPTTVDVLREADDVFSLATARSVATTHFETLSAALSKAMTKTVLPALKERQRKLLSSIGLFVVMKEKYDVQVFAAMAGAMVALRTMPAKLNPIIRSIMNGVKVSYCPDCTDISLRTTSSYNRDSQLLLVPLSSSARRHYSALAPTLATRLSRIFAPSCARTQRRHPSSRLHLPSLELSHFKR